MPQPAAVPHRPPQVGPDLFHAVMSHEMLARLMRVAVHIKLPEAITREPRAVADVARALGLQAAPLGRVLRALADNGVFREVSSGCYAHNANSERLQADHPHSVSAMLSLFGLPGNDGAWAGLPQALQTGAAPFESAFGQALYPYLEKHAEEGVVFNRAMVDNTAMAVEAVVRTYTAFKNHRRVLDVGGGFGQMIAGILKHHTHLQGGVFDQGHLEAPALAYMKQQQLEARCTFVAGDFLKALPEGYDIYLIKNVLWNWSDDNVCRIMAHAAQAMRGTPDARLMVVETLLEEGDAGWASLLDIQMLVMPNGRSRSRKQYDALAQTAHLVPAEACQANPQTTVLTYTSA